MLRYGLAPDSAGPGLHRGGLATEMTFQAFSPNTRVTARNRDRTRFTGWGIAGGRAGGASRFILNPGTNREVDLGNTDILTIGPGDAIHVACGGAGGWGDPLEREPAAVLLDWRRGWVTTDHARDAYGVVIADGAVDADSTGALRAARANGGDGRSGGNGGNGANGGNGSFYDVGAERRAFEEVLDGGELRRAHRVPRAPPRPLAVLRQAPDLRHRRAGGSRANGAATARRCAALSTPSAPSSRSSRSRRPLPPPDRHRARQTCRPLSTPPPQRCGVDRASHSISASSSSSTA